MTPASQPLSPRAWWVFLAVTWSVVAVAQLFAAIPTKPVFGVVVLASLGAVVVGLRRHLRGWTPIWSWFAVGYGLYAAASVLWSVLDPTGAQQLLPVAIHVLGYAFLFAALVRLVRLRHPGGDQAGMIDALAVTVATAVFGWTLVLEPIAADPTQSVIERVVAVAYPLLDLAMVPLMVRLLFGGRRTSFALRALVLSLAAAVLANFAYAYLTWHGSSTSWLAVIYPLGFALTASGALHPSVASLDTALPAADRGDFGSGRPLSWRRFTALGAVSVAVPALALAQTLAASEVDVPVIAGGTIALFSLVAVRMWGLVRQVERLTARRGEERFRALVHNADDVIMVLDPRSRVAFVTPSIQRWGYRPEELGGSLWSEAVHTDDRTKWRNAMRGVTATGQRLVNLHVRVCTQEGAWREVDAAISDLSDDPHVRGVVVTLHDVTERHRLQQELAHQVQHDALTGLPNRTRFLERVRAATADRQRVAAVLFVDIDDFKGFNDGLGHAAGDELLQRVSERILHAVRGGDVAARLGGDEFGVLLSIDDLTEAEAVAGRVLQTIQAPMAVAERQVVVRASVGIAVEEPGLPADALIRQADTAMYAAKARGKGRVQRYDPRLLEQETRRRAIMASLPHVVDEGGLSLDYQPLVALDNGRSVGVEALLRWHHPELGRVGPLEFVPLAEETGLIVPIGRWVLDTACRQAQRWHDDATTSGRPFTITVNLSVVQLRHPQLVDDVAEALDASGLPPDVLVLEVTESVLAGDDTAALLQQLRDSGVRIAVDDFGTGYSSLRYLQRFPLDVLKIDRAFVDVLGDDPTLARAIIGLADALGLRTVAEGIEMPEQAAVLRELGCGLGQGYLFARPLPAAEIEPFLAHAATERSA